MITALTPARPLRALGLILGLWIVGRGVFIWVNADTSLVVVATGQRTPPLPPPRLDLAEKNALTGVFPAFATAAVKRHRFGHFTARRHDQGIGGAARKTDIESVTVPALIGRAPEWRSSAESSAPLVPSIPALAPAAATGTAFAPWSGSFWLAARGGAVAGLAASGGQFGGQLGGAQAGVRVYRHLTPAVALTGRVSTALSTRQSEASVGIALRRGAFSVLAERRIALDAGGRNDWSLTAVAGVDDVALPHDIRLNGYAQIGIVGRDGFADGAARLERTIAGQGAHRLAVGIGSWGSIQPGLARLDIGPHVVARTRLVGQPVRISAEWRQRIAGNAQPGSGPVITLGADF